MQQFKGIKAYVLEVEAKILKRIRKSKNTRLIFRELNDISASIRRKKCSRQQDSGGLTKHLSISFTL